MPIIVAAYPLGSPAAIDLHARLPPRRVFLSRQPRHRTTASLHAGFTLIEVMIVVAVIGILSSIAYPSYTEYVLRGKITEATAALQGLQADMERFYQNNRTYKDAPACDSPKVGNFTISCTQEDANGYVLQAAGEGFTFSIDEKNTRKTSGASTCSSGWATKKGQTAC